MKNVLILSAMLIASQACLCRAQISEEQERWCIENCASEWGYWSSCTQPCAGGTQIRTRTVLLLRSCLGVNSDTYPRTMNCPHALNQSRPCNEGCLHDGIVEDGVCVCADTRTGRCCQQEYTCGYPGIIHNGGVEGCWPTPAGGVAHFWCADGYGLNGALYAVCTKAGWSASSPTCTDVNECDTNEGHGPCEDVCVNTDSGYECLCTTIPGYIKDPSDSHLCLAEYACRNLTTDDAPANGGLVCMWHRSLNSQYCAIRCNPGYEHSVRTLDYVTCGPGTQYEWSSQGDDSTAIPSACVREYFPGIRFEADIFYFTETCNQLTPTAEGEVETTLAEVLNERDICHQDEGGVCGTDVMSILCGRET